MKISLTSFVDYALKAGSPKLTCAQNIKKQLSETYEFREDYYKRFREGVTTLHKTAQAKKDLNNVIGTLPVGKENNYNDMITGYKKFLGNKKTTWFEPKKTVWAYGALEVRINPELGLEWSGDKYLIKLYTKADKLSKDRVACILALMHYSLQPKNGITALLDVRNGKLYEYESQMSKFLALAEAEALSLANLLK